MQAQALGSMSKTIAAPDVDQRDYFGRPLRHYSNLPDAFKDPGHGDDATLVRHSYVFQGLYSINLPGDESRTGGIQLRGRVHAYTPNLPQKLREWLREAARRAAHIYNSGIETPSYSGYNGDGYLTGFNLFDKFENWETERIPRREADTPVGVIDWTTEVYHDKGDAWNLADLSGIAQGTANPYQDNVHTTPGRESIDIPSTKWRIGWEDGRDPSEYYVRPQQYSNASKRYREGAGKGKRVYVNGKPIGSLGPKGRVWLRPEYGRGDPRYSKGSWGTYWSREGLVQETGATYQAIRKGGVLYQVGESENGVYLRTAAEKPDGWKEADPDSVPVDQEAAAGSEPAEYYLLEVRPPTDTVRIDAFRDEELIRHMGMSNPPYTHFLGPADKWDPPIRRASR